jgi:hypothetical protein
VVKGKHVFSHQEADRIRILVSKTRSANRDQQKRLRQQLRDMHFFISDFPRPSSGFTVQDFDEHVRKGRIEVRGA